MKPQPIAIIRLYPERKSRLYARVRVWPTVRAFQKARPDLGRNARGACTGNQWFRFPKGRRRKLGVFCTVELIVGWMGAGTIAHELTHAAIQWVERAGIAPAKIFANARDWGRWSFGPVANVKTHKVLRADSSEERFCYALGEMYRQLNERCHRQKLYRANQADLKPRA